MKPEQPLEFLSKLLVVETCKGEPKLFSEMTHWELLNLKSNIILDIPDRLYQEFGELLNSPSFSDYPSTS